MQHKDSIPALVSDKILNIDHTLQSCTTLTLQAASSARNFSLCCPFNMTQAEKCQGGSPATYEDIELASSLPNIDHAAKLGYEGIEDATNSDIPNQVRPSTAFVQHG
jgi:hypothetical protein